MNAFAYTVFVGCMVDEGFVLFFSRFHFTNIHFFLEFLLFACCVLLVFVVLLLFCWWFSATADVGNDSISNISILLLVATFRGRGLIDFIDENQQQLQNCSSFDDIWWLPGGCCQVNEVDCKWFRRWLDILTSFLRFYRYIHPSFIEFPAIIICFSLRVCSIFPVVGRIRIYPFDYADVQEFKDNS